MLRLLVLRPVEGERAVAFHVQVAGLALRDRFSLVAEDLQLVSGDWLAARSWPHIVESVRAVDVEHLGRSDAVQDRQPESILPAPPDFRGQRFGGGHAMPDRAKVAALRALEVEDRVVKRGRGEKGSRVSLFGRGQDKRGRWAP